MNSTIFKSSRAIIDFFDDFKWFHVLKGGLIYVISKSKKLQVVSNRDKRHYYVVSKKPLIICTCEPIGDLTLFSEQFPDTRAYILVMFWGNLRYNYKKINALKGGFKKHQEKYPNHLILFLCNTQEETDILSNFNPQSYFINHNCLLDPRIYGLIDVPKDLDVIYNGRLDVVKRHYLLRKVQNLNLIVAGQLKKKPAYLDFLKHSLPDALIVNFHPPKLLSAYDPSLQAVLDGAAVNDRINRSKVGVILSSVEGACYASMEYLLGGIPVVSTISLGGRDVFFDNKYCKIVRSNPTSIKNAIDGMIQQEFLPEEVRECALNAIQPHLERFKNIIKDLMDSEEVETDFDVIWEKIYINKMLVLNNEMGVSLTQQLENAPEFH
jgi:glycosyltransferase involved in cell wall biosynthesis